VLSSKTANRSLFKKATVSGRPLDPGLTNPSGEVFLPRRLPPPLIASPMGGMHEYAIRRPSPHASAITHGRRWLFCLISRG